MKALYPDLFPETLLVSREGDRIFTTSLKVAEHFHKRHADVLRAVENLLADIADPSFDEPNAGPINERNLAFIGLNFQPSEYLDSRGRTKPMFRLSHDGFALLVMGFTGKDALSWKVQFLAAFRDMERQIIVQQKRESNALFLIRPKWGPIIARPELRRQQLIGLTGHKSPNSITACRRRMRQVGLLSGEQP